MTNDNDDYKFKSNMNTMNTSSMIHRRSLSTIIRNNKRSRLIEASSTSSSKAESINTPFETHLSSATSRFRGERSGLSSATDGAAKAGEVSYDGLTVVGGRLRRDKVGCDVQLNDRGGSFAATLSATAKYRQKRRNMSEIKQKIPSILSIPVSDGGTSSLRTKHNLNTIEQTATSNVHGLTTQQNREGARIVGITEDKASSVEAPFLKLVVGGSVTVTTLSLYFGVLPLF